MTDHHHRGKGDAVKCLEGRALGVTNVHLPPSPQTLLISPPVSNREADSATKTEAAIDAAKRAIETAEGALAKADDRENSGTSGSFLEGHKELNYADPGYQSDGKRRYPIDTERHIRAGVELHQPARQRSAIHCRSSRPDQSGHHRCLEREDRYRGTALGRGWRKGIVCTANQGAL